MVCRPTPRHSFFVFGRDDFTATTSAGSDSFGGEHVLCAAPTSAGSVNSAERVLSAATVSDEMSLFNNLDSDAKISRMYEFMFTHMRGLETRLNEVAKNTSELFSQVDARLQALEQRAVE